MNCWILQGNPNNYCWLESIKEHGNEPDTWGINPRNKERLDKIKLCDIAFIWLSNEYERSSKVTRSRGIYAMAQITGEPDEKRKPFPYEKPYWINKEERDRIYQYPRLEIRYTNTKFVDKFISKDELEAAGLGDLHVIRQPQGTLFEVTAEQCNSIVRIIESR